MEKEHIRYYIFMRSKLDVSAADIHREFCAVKGESYVSYRDVVKWVHEFHEGRESIEDAPRPGRPVTQSIEKNKEAVRQLIVSDPHVSLRYIVAETELSYSTIQNIITNDLKLKKLCSRWVPHFLTDEQKKERVRICKENLANF